jgi:hypothetical protein
MNRFYIDRLSVCNIAANNGRTLFPKIPYSLQNNRPFNKHIDFAIGWDGNVPNEDSVNTKLTEAFLNLCLLARPYDVVIGEGRVNEVHEDVLAPLHWALHLGKEWADILPIHIVAASFPLWFQDELLWVFGGHLRIFISLFVLRQKYSYV